VVGCCEYGDEHMGSIKRGEFLDKIRNCDFSRKPIFHGDSLVSQSVRSLVSTCIKLDFFTQCGVTKAKQEYRIGLRR
jgi:hypothetical protein